jgi:hypothetical protein
MWQLASVTFFFAFSLHANGLRLTLAPSSWQTACLSNWLRQFAAIVAAYGQT